MKQADDIKRIYEQAKIDTLSSRDEAILKKMKEVFLQESKAQPEKAEPSVWRIIMKSKMFKVAAAAVIVITSLVCIQFLTGTSAYAQVAAELRNARTVVFTLITQTNQGNGETVNTDVAYKEPGHLRTTTVDGYIAIVDGTSGKMISIVPQGGYTLAEIDCFNKTDGTGPFASIQAMKNLPAKADERLGQKEIDGIDCDGYKVTQGDLAKTVWLDAKTGDLVQVELKYASAPGMDKIIKNIKFDIVLEDSLFSLTPPAGYKPFGVELKSDVAAETEETFIAWLRWWPTANVDETFPPMVAGSEIAKVVMDMGREGKLKGPGWDNREAGLMFKALLFVARLPASSNWRYAGNGVKFGTTDKAIFWYKPTDSKNYRVIYGDLQVREVAPEDLPK
jgi:outer membrane lipoprotein-sorting protein